MALVVYSLENCPHCEELKAFLTKSGFEYDERDMQLMDSMVDMRVDGIFAMEAPVLKYENGEAFAYFESNVTFPGGKLDEHLVSEAAQGRSVL
jgi:glutaredoxin